MPSETFENLTPRISTEAFVHTGAYVIGDVEIGAHSSVWPAVVLRGDHGIIRIGERTSIQDGSVAHATENVSRVDIGNDCTIGHRVILHGCRVGHSCLVGMGSILLDNVELEDFCFVGAGSLLTPGKKFPSGSFILGSPGKRIREITSEEKAWIEYSSRAYQDLARRHRSPSFP